MTPSGVVDRFRMPWGRIGPAEPIVVAVSGGLDSTVLLHLLRFESRLDPARLVVAHFDHGLRATSAGDARWVRGLARAWGLPFRHARSDRPPSSEAAARDQRYTFLDAVRAEVGATWVVTAHHADDQAETVLFRALRGTGLEGLGGMHEVGVGHRLRPLLPFWRGELEAYARRVRLDWRLDATNLEVAFARNAVRHELLPLAERIVAPGARRALVRLARNARRDARAWRSVERTLLEPVLERRGPGRFVLDRQGFRAYHPAVRARLLRSVARELGVSLDEAGTRLGVSFTSRGASGQEVHLTGGLRLRRSFHELELTRESPLGNERAGALPDIRIDGLGPGERTVTGPSGAWRARWGVGRDEALGAELHLSLRPYEVRFPLCLRGWNEGDRVRLSYGSKRVAKLLAEAGVPRWERTSRWVLADGAGRVLWVPGVARSVDAAPTTEQADFHIGLEHADSE